MLTKRQCEEELKASMVDYFSSIEDPRVERTRAHPLASILSLSLCAILCGAESFVAIEDFGEAREEWLRTFIDLPNGIPSHDTIGRVFAALNPTALERAFREWVTAVATVTDGEVVAIDGKTLRRSFQRAGGAFVHMVSAWATSNRVVLGQVKTDDKSNEITAIPKLLELLHVRGCLVTIDAMGCQKAIVQKIVESKADYLIAVKDNQAKLHAAIAAEFEDRIPSLEKAQALDFHETEETKHGRHELRRCWTLSDLSGIPQREDWNMFSTAVLVETERTLNDKTATHRRYYISSVKDMSARHALASARAHWGIENELHWVLDVAFREDDCRARIKHSAENFAVLRHIAINLLRNVSGPKPKVGIFNRRLRCAWSPEFLMRALGIGPRV